MFVYPWGWLSGVECCEGWLLEGKHQASNEYRGSCKQQSGSQLCDWSQFDSHQLPPPPPPSLPLGYVESGQMTSFWQDYPKPGSNIYSTHNTFLQYAKQATIETAYSPAPVLALCWSFLTVFITSKQCTHQNEISLQNHLETAPNWITHCIVVAMILWSDFLVNGHISAKMFNDFPKNDSLQ